MSKHSKQVRLGKKRPLGPWIVTAIAAAMVPVGAQDAPSGGAGTKAPEMSLGPIVITGTRTERNILDVPVRTELITAEEIDLTSSLKLADIVEYQPGLRVESNCQNCNTSEIRMLGLQQRYIAVLTDGMPMFSGLAGVYGIEQIPTGTIEQIEVVKGGGSTLYGPNAVAGVVNIIPKKPTHTHVRLDSQYSFMEGDQSGTRPNTDLTGVFEHASKDQKWGVLAYGLQNYVQGVDVTEDEFTEVTRRDLYGGGIRLTYDPSDSVAIAFDYLLTNEERRGGEDDEALGIPANEAFTTEELKSTRHVGIATLKHSVSENFDYQAGLSLAYTGRDSYYGGVAVFGHPDAGVNARLATRFPGVAITAPIAGWTPGLGFGETENLLTTLDISANSYLTDSHTLTYGFQTRMESIEDVSGLGRTVDDQYDNFGLYAQHSWIMSEEWEVIWGLRGDKHSKVPDPIVSPRAAVKFSPGADLDWRFSASTGFRAPEVFDEDLHIANVGGEVEVVTLSPNLTEERSLSFAFGPNWRIDKQWTFDGSLFYTKLSDTFLNDPSTDIAGTPVIESTKINSGSAQIYGVELNLSYSIGNYAAEIGYIEQRSEYGSPQLLIGEPGNAVDNPIFSEAFERTPNRYGVMKLSYDNSQWAGYVAGKLTGRMSAPHVNSVPTTGAQINNTLDVSPNFFVVDIGLSHTWALGDHKDLTVSFAIKNLFDEFQDDLDNGPYRDAAYVLGPRFPRTYFAGLTLEF